MRLRVTHSTSSPSPNGNQQNGDAHNHENDHSSHGHSHSIFSSHTHSREDGYSTQGAESVVNALQGRADAGSRITIIGLLSNVGLTVSKGVAGWFMNSAALLAEAGHSASDLMGDFVTLFCWRLSRKPPTEKYPYGFGRFETVGTVLVSLTLIGGSLGIGFHSYNLLLHHLLDTVATMPPGAAQAVLQKITQMAQSASGVGQWVAHDHGHAHVLDPNAAWFAAISVVLKEWLYWATKKVADEERSSVLYANAIHHRSDAYSSFIALVAILGTWWFPALPLDQIGGLVVAIVILRQGCSLLGGAFGELTGAGVSPRTKRTLEKALEPLLQTASPNAEKDLLAVRDLRAFRSGATMYVDLTAHVSDKLNILEASQVEATIKDALRKTRKEVLEVRVSFHPESDKVDSDCH